MTSAGPAPPSRASRRGPRLPSCRRATAPWPNRPIGGATHPRRHPDAVRRRPARHAAGRLPPPGQDALRSQLNAWLRTDGPFDAVIDLDAALRDPADPSRMAAAYDSGDHLHPGDAGNRAMAEAVDLDALLGGQGQSPFPMERALIRPTNENPGQARGFVASGWPDRLTCASCARTAPASALPVRSRGRLRSCAAAPRSHGSRTR